MSYIYIYIYIEFYLIKERILYILGLGIWFL